jgi:hypothetical protein
MVVTEFSDTGKYNMIIYGKKVMLITQNPLDKHV